MLLIIPIVICILVFKNKITKKLIEPFFHERYFNYFNHNYLNKKVLGIYSNNLNSYLLNFSESEISEIEKKLDSINHDRSIYYIFIPIFFSLVTFSIFMTVLLNFSIFMILLIITLAISFTILNHLFFKEFMNNVKKSNEEIIKIYYVNLEINQIINQIHKYIFTYGLIMLLLFLNLLATTNPKDDIFLTYCKSNSIQLYNDGYSKKSYIFFSIFSANSPEPDYTIIHYIGIFNIFVSIDNYYIIKILRFYNYIKSTEETQKLKTKYGW